MKHTIENRGFLISSVQASFGNIFAKMMDGPIDMYRRVIRIGYYDKDAEFGAKGRGYDFIRYNKEDGMTLESEEVKMWSYGKLHEIFKEMSDKEPQSITYDDETTEVVIITTDGTTLSVYMNKNVMEE